MNQLIPNAKTTGALVIDANVLVAICAKEPTAKRLNAIRQRAAYGSSWAKRIRPQVKQNRRSPLSKKNCS